LNLIPVWVLDGGQATLALGKSERWFLLAACLGLWFLFHENTLILVAGGFGWRLFTKDLAPNPSRTIATYYVAVLAALAAIMWIMPAAGLGRP
jgi:Zn-dependent protease